MKRPVFSRYGLQGLSKTTEHLSKWPIPLRRFEPSMSRIRIFCLEISSGLLHHTFWSVSTFQRNIYVALKLEATAGFLFLLQISSAVNRSVGCMFAVAVALLNHCWPINSLAMI
jgi:hypothetical protein